ncbi:hypothetical protein OfM2_02170 [Lactovum odontotermitis]
MRGKEFYLDDGDKLVFCHVSDVLAVWDEESKSFTALMSATSPMKKFSSFIVVIN